MGTHDEVPEQAKRAAGWLVWLLVLAVIVVAAIGLLLLGPFGLAVGIPMAIIAWIVIGTAASGPAAGA
jgi:hypothetical protein